MLPWAGLDNRGKIRHNHYHFSIIGMLSMLLKCPNRTWLALGTHKKKQDRVLDKGWGGGVYAQLDRQGGKGEGWEKREGDREGE